QRRRRSGRRSSGLAQECRFSAGATIRRVYGDQLAVVTVTYSPGESLEAFLDSLEKATTRPYTVVLADNGSVDGAPERAAERTGVELLRIGENVGYGTAATRAIAGLGDEVGWVVVAT